MNYPSIYSLSTVGILKHYVHDYLFHPKRTDFIGANGVGKSILADLLQLIFIYDKSLIKFGTDGVKEEDRQIHTLPYKTTHAYCFLNIEVEAGKFILIGIQIGNQKGKRIIPFVITKQADIQLKVEQLTLSKDEVLFAEDLIKRNESSSEIPDLNELTELIHQKHQLRLNSFKNNDDISDYYRFLYDKNILPLNLNQEKNLKAYAKVIQSFSKAKTLNLSGNHASRSLKEFLFEESDEDIFINFQKEETQLVKILREYQSLNKVIETLNEKQKKLIDLRSLEQSYNESFKQFKKAELNNENLELNQLTKQEKSSANQLKHKNEECESVQKALKKLPDLQARIKASHEEVETFLFSFNRFEELSAKTKSLQEDIQTLQTLDFLSLDEDWKNQVSRIDISIRSIENIKKDSSYVRPYLEKYPLFENLTATREEQKQLLDNLRLYAKTELEEKERLLPLLTEQNENSLISWYIRSLPDVSNEQLQALLYFSSLPTSRTDYPENKARYINADEFLKNFKSESTENGIWLKLGAISEFIAFQSDANLLGNKVDLQKSVQQLVEKLKGEIQLLKKKLQIFNDISEGKSYDSNLVKEFFEVTLMEASLIENLKSAIACILQVGEKILQLQNELKQSEEELQNLQSKFQTKTTEPTLIKQELVAILKIWNGRREKAAKYSGIKEAQRDSLGNEKTRLENESQTLLIKLNNQQKQLEALSKSYQKEFGEDFSGFGTNKLDIETIQSKYEEEFEEYMLRYIGVTHAFEETSNEKNTAVQLSIHNHVYSFKQLEEVLLGAKIKTTDEITTALQEANQTRISIADGLRDAMIKIFGRTVDRYEKYEDQIKLINAFFVNRKISEKFEFKLDFEANKDLRIDYVKELAYKVRETATRGELNFGESITDFVEDFFKKQAKIKTKVPIDKLLNPKTFFELSAKLTDQFGVETSGSTGESYSAIALLGVARLSVQKEQRKGLRFIILEELGSLDSTNFKTFPKIAEELNYQIITMAPHTFNIGFSEEWYAHHLIKGKQDDKINYYPSSSYFKSSDHNEALSTYLNKVNK